MNTAIQPVEITFYPNGQKKTECHFREGILHGKVIVWDEEGHAVFETVYRNGIELTI